MFIKPQIGSAVSNPAAALLPTIVGWYPLNEAQGSPKLNVHDGTKNFSAGTNPTAAGHISATSMLCGAAYAAPPEQDSTIFEMGERFTLSCWLYPTAFGSDEGWFGNWGGWGSSFLLGNTVSTENLAFYIGGGNPTVAMTLNEWQQISIAWDTTDSTSRIRRNVGAWATAQYIQPALLGLLGSPFVIGNYGTTGREPEGRIEQLVWANKVWTDEECALYYNGGDGIDYPE